jgi:hypothetical protein
MLGGEIIDIEGRQLGGAGQACTVSLGFATGLRPSSIRPLRRCGDKPDVLWEQGVLLVRRSQTGDQEPMETTKTGKLQRITLPEDLIEILDWHAKQLPAGPMLDSDLCSRARRAGTAPRAASIDHSARSRPCSGGPRS